MSTISGPDSGTKVLETAEVNFLWYLSGEDCRSCQQPIWTKSITYSGGREDSLFFGIESVENVCNCPEPETVMGLNIYCEAEGHCGNHGTTFNLEKNRFYCAEHFFWTGGWDGEP